MASEDTSGERVTLALVHAELRGVRAEISGVGLVATAGFKDVQHQLDLLIDLPERVARLEAVPLIDLSPLGTRVGSLETALAKVGPIETRVALLEGNEVGTTQRNGRMIAVAAVLISLVSVLGNILTSH